MLIKLHPAVDLKPMSPAQKLSKSTHLWQSLTKKKAFETDMDPGNRQGTWSLTTKLIHSLTQKTFGGPDINKVKLSEGPRPHRPQLNLLNLEVIGPQDKTRQDYQ